MKNLGRYIIPAILIGLAILIPVLGFASVESSLATLQNKLLNVILPVVGIVGLGFAAISFFIGSPNARGHLTLAVMGAAVGFGAPAIIAFIRSIVQ